MNNLTSSTELGISPDLLNKIKTQQFCIVGCGGVGAYFAEMLVRTGAPKINLIDNDRIEHKNLNRTPFVLDDIGKYKVDILKKRLNKINADAIITTTNMAFGCYAKNDKPRQDIRDLVVNSDVTIIAVDKNRYRIECENLLKDFSKQYLVIGVEINQVNASAKYVCGWMTTTNNNDVDQEGYGERNGSYMSIVLEAVSAGFNMMMHCLETNNHSMGYICREYSNHKIIKNIEKY